VFKLDLSVCRKNPLDDLFDMNASMIRRHVGAVAKAQRGAACSTTKVSNREAVVSGFGRSRFSTDLRAMRAALGLVSQASPVHTAVRNCNGDEGDPFGCGDQIAEPGTFDIIRIYLEFPCNSQVFHQ